MPIPFNDLGDDANLGLAGFLRFEEEADGKGIRAALFLIASRGEPAEFSFTRIDVAESFLWRAGEARRHAVAALAKTLFESNAKQPTVLLSLAEEVPPHVFTADLEVRIPICRLAPPSTTVQAASESLEVITDAINLFWIGGQPESDSPARELIEALRGRQLLTEPFERASMGLREAFDKE